MSNGFVSAVGAFKPTPSSIFSANPPVVSVAGGETSDQKVVRFGKQQDAVLADIGDLTQALKGYKLGSKEAGGLQSKIKQLKASAANLQYQINLASL
jgi:hypothetical protein